MQTHSTHRSPAARTLATRALPVGLIATAALALSACGSMSGNSMMVGSTMSPAHALGQARNQSILPAAVQVPAGHKPVWVTRGSGDITYACKPKADNANMFEWGFVGPEAKLWDRQGKEVGRYFGPPATWQSMDGSSTTGKQLAVAPSSAGNIPLQLVQATPDMSKPGLLKSATYIQRLDTKGGVAPNLPCNASANGKTAVVQYAADYVVWAAQ